MFWYLIIIGHILSKAHYITLTLGLLQQQAHVTSHIKTWEFE